MIVVRDVFHLRSGAGREARGLLRPRSEIMARAGLAPTGQLMSLTGPADTIVIETTHASVSDWQKVLGRVHEDPEWAAWFERFRPLVESGRREIFNVLEHA